MSIKKREEDMACAWLNNKIDIAIISICEVSIKISHQYWKNSITNYAKLVNCSQRRFIRQDLLKDLDEHGQKLTLNLKIFTGKIWEETLMVCNLKVAGVNKMNGWIPLPKVYLKNTLPFEKDEAAIPDKVSRRKYLDSIKLELTKAHEANWSQLYETSEDSQNYSQQRWCVLMHIK